ncbi:MAG: sterol desaturase family protein [Nitrospirales bacterium]
MMLDMYFAIFFLSWAILRVGFVALLTRLSRSSWAEQQRIYKISIPPDQDDREQWWAVPFYIDAAGFALLTYGGLLQFTEWAVFPTYTQTVTGFIALALAHTFIAEPLYYGYHLLLHKNPTLRRHHVKHHKATVPRPPSGYTFTVFERVSYLVLFALPVLIIGWLEQLTPVGFFAYFLVFDFLNSIGHGNVEFFPKWYVNSSLKWVIYSPSFHSLHHSRWEANYTLFMPMYDWLFGTVASESDVLFTHAQDGRGPTDMRRLTPQQDRTNIELTISG